MSSNSRARAQAETRRLLKQAGRKKLLSDGFPATSVAAIAEEAGFTTGAFYSNFASKGELTLEVLSDLQQEVQAELAEIMGGPVGSKTVDRLQQWCDRVLESGWPRLELEFALSIRDDDELVSTEGRRNRAAVGGLTSLIADRLPLPEEGPVRAQDVAEMILNIAFGIAVRKVIDPRVNGDSVFDVIRTLVTDSVG